MPATSEPFLEAGPCLQSGGGLGCTTLRLEDLQPVRANETCHSPESRLRLHLLRSNRSSVGDAQAHDRAIGINPMLKLLWIHSIGYVNSMGTREDGGDARLGLGFQTIL